MSIVRFDVTALDCPDPVALATFYATLTGFAVEHPGDLEDPDVEWITLDNAGQPTLGFQRVPAYVAPTWPEGPVPQQLHLDFNVDDLDEGESFVLSLGATKAAYQPGTSFRVYLDPVGHPFCLVRAGNDD